VTRFFAGNPLNPDPRVAVNRGIATRLPTEAVRFGIVLEAERRRWG